MRRGSVPCSASETRVMDRPRTRGECPEERPCPFVGCRYHLAIGDIRKPSRHTRKHASPDGVCLAYPELELEELPETCALDVADRGGATLEHVGAILYVTRERVRQLEAKALRRLRLGLITQHIVEGEDVRTGKRKLSSMQTKNASTERSRRWRERLREKQQLEP